VEYTALYRGKRHYELSNHLGNVQVVISDKRVSICDEYLAVERFEAEVLSAVDYYPGGMLIPGRQGYAGNDSALAINGFNGMRNDHEINGHGNAVDFGARIYDSRLVRWLSLDPLQNINPGMSPFVGMGNNPVFFVDGDGRYIIPTNEFNKSKWGLVLQTVKTTQFTSKKIQEIFNTLNSKEKNWNVTYVYISPVTIPTPLASTKVSEGLPGTNFNRSATVLLLDIIPQGGRYKAGILTDLAMAKNMLHEMIHTHLATENPNSTEAEQHEIMANEYANDLIQSVLDFASQNGIKTTRDVAEALVWQGFKGTKKYEEKYGKIDENGLFVGTETQRKSYENMIKLVNENSYNYEELTKEQVKEESGTNETGTSGQNNLPNR